ncbi:hypothetical protein GCM10009422_18320 [Brevundimonas kwangchunensis]|uniref:Uncharacterized protein n=2 Tax=Brevundimonas kwangchunensis TaxID=322163 RepID=A0ABN1GXH7_9CAUL
MFHSRLKHLQDSTGAPFLRRWQHEWEWLQVADLRAEGNPSFFFQGDRNSTGQFDFGDRETYVSAFLRTLAYAAAHWGLPNDIMTFFARAAITLNRGLADVACVARPAWTDDVIIRDQVPSTAAAELWRNANLAVGGEMIVALRVAEVTETAYVQYEFRYALGLMGGFDHARPPREQGWLIMPRAEYAGPLDTPGKIETFEKPTALCGMTMPMDVGRMLVDVVPHVQLPAQLSSTDRAEISTTSDSVVLSVEDEPVATWRYWYADWDPAVPKGVDSLLSYTTSVKADSLKQKAAYSGRAGGVWCDITWGTREYSYSDFTEASEGFWAVTPAPL